MQSQGCAQQRSFLCAQLVWAVQGAACPAEPLPTSTQAIRTQLTALQQQRSNHQVSAKNGQVCR